MGWRPGVNCPWAQANPIESRGFGACTSGSCDMHEGGKRCERKKGAQQRRKAEGAAYRKFPGNPLQQARTARVWAAIRAGESVDNAHLGPGRCKWCEGEILKPGGGEVNLRRGWHDGRGDEPDCLFEYYAHTRQPEQLAAIIERDGTRCACCGEEKGRWVAGRRYTPEQVASWGGSFLRYFPPETHVGPWTAVHRQASLECDHVLALALVVLTIPAAEQWRYWGPMNLQGLCSRCHADKTAADVRLIKAARKLAEIPEAI